MRHRFLKLYRDPGGAAGGGTAAGAAAAQSNVQSPGGGRPAAPPATQNNAAQGSDLASLNQRLADLQAKADADADKIKAYEQADTDRKTAQMTEQQKAEQAAADAAERTKAVEAKLREERTERLIEKAAAKLDITDEDTVLALIATKPAYALTYDDKGNPTNLDAVLAKIVADKPHLVKPSDIRSAGNPGRSRVQQPSGNGDLASALAAHYNK